MNFQRIWALSLTRLYPLIKKGQIFQMIIGPVILTVIFGFLSEGLAEETRSTAPLILMATTVIWQLVMYPHQEITLVAISELSSSGLTQLFSTPLTKYELTAALLLPSIITTGFVFLVCSALMMIVHGYNPLFLGLPLIPLLINLLVFGATFGLFAATVVVRFGEQLGHFAQLLDWFIVPVSGVYYPYDKMPEWLQFIGKLLPLSYIFGFIRGEPWALELGYGTIVFRTLVLGLFYLALVFFLFNRALEKIRMRGATS